MPEARSQAATGQTYTRISEIKIYRKNKDKSPQGKRKMKKTGYIVRTSKKPSEAKAKHS